MRALILLLLATPAAMSAQPPDPAEPTCEAEFAWITDHAARNYAGFDVKTASEAGTRYQVLLGELKTLAVEARNPRDCDAVLARWIAYFGDGHITFGRAATPAAASESTAAESDDAIRARLSGRERLELTEAEARARIEARGAARSPLEGIWQLGDAYRVAVVHDERPDRHYTMTTLRADSVWWTPGQVKATFARSAESGYDVRFYMRDHSEQAWKGRVVQNVLVLDQGSPWFRVWVSEPGDLTPEQYEATQNRRFAARDLAQGTVLLQIPTFADPQGINSLFAAEGERIRAAERLVIDLRDNGGGSDFNFRHLIPLIYTNPIRNVGTMALATNDNLRAHEALIGEMEMAEEQAARFRDWIGRVSTVRGGWYEFPDETIEHPAVLERPRSVAILVNRGCASSCEQFLLAARQSTKVTMFGDRSAGILDFGNVRTGRMPQGPLMLHYPTTRSKRLPNDPVDPHGIHPHVRIPDSEIFPIDWVLRYLEAESRSR
jgi:hypothetical protein